MHGTGAASDWVTRWAAACPARGRALDLACGGGRHLRWLAAQGWTVTGVDRDAQALASLQGLGELIQADLEGAAWPLAGRQFELVVVTHYLWRALWPDLLGALAPGGLLIYETFASGQQTVGRPSRPEFLLQPGELLQACAGLRVLAYEDGVLADPQRFVQRIAAAHDADRPPGQARWPLPAWAGALG
jgi:SAM-dependent methyltransferase